MKVKLTALLFLAGASAFAGTRVFFGVGIGYPARPPVVAYAPPPVVAYAPPPVYAPPYAAYVPVRPGPGYTWVAGYWHPAGHRWAWRAGYWARPPYARGRWVAPRYHRGYYYRGHWRR